MSIIDTILGRPVVSQPNPPPAPPPAPADQREPINPLDSYKAMLENANKPAEDTSTPSFSLDGKVLEDVGSKLNFTRELILKLCCKKPRKVMQMQW